MNRYASHYLYVPQAGFLKNHAVEVEAGRVVRYFALHDEHEDTQWLPGIIEIASTETMEAFHLYPFDFTTMKPVDGTQRRRLM